MANDTITIKCDQCNAKTEKRLVRAPLGAPLHYNIPKGWSVCIPSGWLCPKCSKV